MGSGCDKEAQGADKLVVERLPDIKPSLPSVPQLPPPPFPIKYSDQSYSVFGLRKNMRNTIGKEVTVRGYVVKIYEPPPPCKKGEECPKPLAPHAWIADETGAPEDKWIKVADYADNQDEVTKAIAAAKRGAYKPPPPETGLPPIPTDFEVGRLVNVRGRFVYMSSRGFNDSNGLLEYLGHESLEQAPAQQ